MKLNAQSLDTGSLQTAKSANKMSKIRYYLLTNGARFNALFRNNQMNSVSGGILLLIYIASNCYANSILIE